MRVILKDNIENLGKKGDIIEVAPGYGRNYLLPKRLAIEVTPSNMKMIEMEKQALRKRFEQERSSYQDLIQKINDTKLSFFRKTAEKDVVFGSVSSADIKDALQKLGIEVDKKKILLEEPIKRMGNYSIPIKIFHDERAEVKVEVLSEEENAVKETTKKEEDKAPREEKKEESMNKKEGAPGEEGQTEEEKDQTGEDKDREGKKE
ncbi:MAG: 50S ribosomal protein L9 [Candidatus Aminicenantes bacterium]